MVWTYIDACIFAYYLIGRACFALAGVFVVIFISFAFVFCAFFLLEEIETASRCFTINRRQSLSCQFLVALFTAKVIAAHARLLNTIHLSCTVIIVFLIDNTVAIRVTDETFLGLQVTICGLIADILLLKDAFAGVFSAIDLLRAVAVVVDEAAVPECHAVHW